jgi:hypothetical protein
MPWTTTLDPGEFLAAAGGFVRSRLVEHNVILTITARLPRAGGSRGGGRCGPVPARPCTAASACTGSVSWRPLIRRR